MCTDAPDMYTATPRHVHTPPLQLTLLFTSTRGLGGLLCILELRDMTGAVLGSEGRCGGLPWRAVGHRRLPLLLLGGSKQWVAWRAWRRYTGTAAAATGAE